MPANPFGDSVAAAPSYTGPERRALRSCFAASLDEVDYGMLLVSETHRVVHANHAALTELDGEHPLRLVGHELQARSLQDTQALHAALHDAARRHLRKLLTLGERASRVSMSIVPIGDATALVMLGKRQICGTLSVQGFARTHGLTPAETRVLLALCEGALPAEVAAELGVGIATVRTQIGSIRQKTGADSIRALVRQVAVLPPLMGALRNAVTPMTAPGHRAAPDAPLLAA